MSKYYASDSRDNIVVAVDVATTSFCAQFSKNYAKNVPFWKVVLLSSKAKYNEFLNRAAPNHAISE